MADKILEIKDLRFNYQTDLETAEAVNGIDLEIEKSGTLGLDVYKRQLFHPP